jgi:threonine synthase
MCPHILLATAHPIKFSEVVKDKIKLEPEEPESVRDLFTKPQHKTKILSDYQALKKQLLWIG